jgi:hypothetical protein
VVFVGNIGRVIDIFNICVGLLIAAPSPTEHHGAQGQGGHLQARMTQRAVAHGAILLPEGKAQSNTRISLWGKSN